MTDESTPPFEGDYDENQEGIENNFSEYDIVSSPNDFNIKTLYDFIESGVVIIPGFQRNYVWDIKRASKLIESIIIGLPVPQIFLYEEERNKFLVIDGQQRLMTVYYFIKKKFPRKEKRVELRKIFAEKGNIPEEILNDKTYFTDFDLVLPDLLSDKKNKFQGLNYSTLADYKTIFELRTIRNIIVKQTLPKEEEHSSKYEIFNRLNSGGVNLTAQEIRTSLYHSDFYTMLYKINLDKDWRNIIGKQEADLHMKDIEILLRGFGMLVEGEKYTAPMTRFLNDFSNKAKKYDNEKIKYLESLFLSFIKSASQLDPKAFLSKSGKFNISIYESIFTAICKHAYATSTTEIKGTTTKKVETLKINPEFISATQEGVAGKTKVAKRLELAMQIL